VRRLERLTCAGKVELQKLADETGLTIKVRHYPPGTSKWSLITQNWRGRPLTDHATVIEHIARDNDQDRAQS
jgi:hypothetical protein